MAQLGIPESEQCQGWSPATFMANQAQRADTGSETLPGTVSPTGTHWWHLLRGPDAPWEESLVMVLCCAVDFHPGFWLVEKCLVWLNPNPQRPETRQGCL